MSLPVSFLSDYGYADEFVGVCHSVIAQGAPQSQLIDITHGIERHDVRSGALILRRSLPYFAAGVHLAVVDARVGGERRALALRSAEDDRLFVGPDNGLLSLAVQYFGGIAEAVEISLSAHRLQPVSPTFHGRDIFAPVAAQLAAGADIANCGLPIDPAEVELLEMPLAQAEGDQLIAHVLIIDTYGNVTLDVEHDELAGFGLSLGQQLEVNGRSAPYVTSYVEVQPGALMAYEDSYRSLALAVNRGSAAEALGLALDDEVRIIAR